MSHVITLDGLNKDYGSIHALSDVNLDVPAGTIFGFLGPNGAGKTTTLRVLIGMLRATGGAARVLGLDPWSERVQLHQRVGYLPSGMGFYERMTGRDLLDYTASLLSGEGRTSPLRARALEAMSLDDAVLDRRIRQYSKGMQQKLAIVQAIQHDPELLLLDEPSEGLDPLVQHSFYDLLKSQRDAGRTIFFSSHTLSEVQALCDHVAIIRAGHIVASAPYEQLAESHPRVVKITAPGGGAAALASLGDGWRIVGEDAGQFTLHTTAAPTHIIHSLSALTFTDVTIEPASLEDVFLGYYESPGSEHQ